MPDQAPVQMCPRCFRLIPAEAKKCECGFKEPRPIRDVIYKPLFKTSDEVEVLIAQLIVTWVAIFVAAGWTQPPDRFILAGFAASTFLAAQFPAIFELIKRQAKRKSNP